MSFGFALLLTAGVDTARASEANDTDSYQPTHSILHRIVHVTVNEDGTADVVTDLARRPDNARGVRVLGEDKIRFREAMMRLYVTEAWSVTPGGKRIDVPVESVRVKDDDDEGDGDSDNKVATIIYPGLELGSTVHRRSRAVHHTMPYPGHLSMSFHSAPRIRVGRYEVNIVHPAKIPIQVLADRFEGGRVALQPGDSPESVRYRFSISHEKYWPRQGSELDIADWAPSLLMSTFPDYATLAAAYQSRAAPRAEPDDEIRALAREVTQGASNDREKVARIRNWVNRNIRYLSVHFGVEGWIPHPAPHVLKTRYGDCKDQTAFMQAMLRAVGIDSTPALINTRSSYYLPRLPLAGAFDHVIVYIPSLGLYVDPTDRYSALGSLPEALYGKPALLTASGQVVRLPVVSPDRDFVETSVRMRVDEQGRVRGNSTARIVGAEEGDSRRTQHGARSRSMEDRINEILQRYDEGGTGRLWASDPLTHGEPWVVHAEFELESVVNLPGP
ncbi:MAG: transglutaminase domain-containing protein, partial [Betaproteobacteria bacterium]